MKKKDYLKEPITWFRLDEWVRRISNKNKELEEAISSVSVSLPYKEFFFKALGQGVQPLLVFTDTFDSTPVFSSGALGTSVLTSQGAFPNLDKVLIYNGISVTQPSLLFNPTQDSISINTPNGAYIKIRVYN